MADFSGRLNDIRFYDRILERDEVRVLYEESSLGEILYTPLDGRTASQRAKVLHHFLNEGGPAETLSSLSGLAKRAAAAEAFEDALPSVMVMKDEMRRKPVYSIVESMISPGIVSRRVCLPRCLPIDDDLPTIAMALRSGSCRERILSLLESP